jgi:hypothetical protein
MSKKRAFGQKYCPLPSLLLIAIILAQFQPILASKVLPIALTY